jgi:dUTP pyrophosphatase
VEHLKNNLKLRRKINMMANGLKILCIKAHKDAIVPVYEHEDDAACSLRVIEDYIIKPGKRILARTGLKIAIPKGFEAQVRPRSGNAWKKGLTVLNTPGTIDSQYRGEVMVILINLGDEDIIIQKGDAVAQMKFSPVYTGYFMETDNLNSTQRGIGGMGSTGR